MQIEVREELAAQSLSGTALEEHVVGQDNGGASVGVQDRGDVLDEVELLVAGGRDEVLPLDRPMTAGGVLLWFPAPAEVSEVEVVGLR